MMTLTLGVEPNGKSPERLVRIYYVLTVMIVLLLAVIFCFYIYFVKRLEQNKQQGPKLKYHKLIAKVYFVNVINKFFFFFFYTIPMMSLSEAVALISEV